MTHPVTEKVSEEMLTDQTDGQEHTDDESRGIKHKKIEVMTKAVSLAAKPLANIVQVRRAT